MHLGERIASGVISSHVAKQRFVGLSNIHICIYGVKRANYQRSYFEPCGKSAFFVSIPGDSWKRESERERGVRQSGVFLVSPVTGAKSTTVQ